MKTVMSTLWSDTPRWNRLVEYAGEETAGGTLADQRTFWRLSRGKDTIIVNGSATLRNRYRDLVFAIALKARRPRPQILIVDATWEKGSRALTAKVSRVPLLGQAIPWAIERFIGSLDGPHVRYGVLSSDEVLTFPREWGVDPERVVFTPFPATIDPDTPTSRGDYIFAGGNSLRRYDLLEQALTGVDADVRVCATWQPATEHPRWQVGPVPHEEFVSLLAGCAVAVVPLVQTIRSAGQQSYLNAMLLGKPVIVTRAAGVADYIEDGVTGVIVDPDPEALRAAIVHALDPANRSTYEAMGAAARAHVLATGTITHWFDQTLLGAAGVPADA